MKNHSIRLERCSNRQTPNRIEELAISIEDHLTALDEKTHDLDAEIAKAEDRGFTPDEIETIDLTYVMTPLLMLLITARTMIDGLPENSGFDRDQIIEIIERNENEQAASHKTGTDLLDLIRKCLDYIKERTSEAADEDLGKLPLIH